LFEVLDGHRIEVQSRTPTSYVDRWGNPIFLRVDAQESSGGSVPRFRVNGRPNLFLAIPTLTSPPGKELSVALYETADVFLGPRAVSLRGEDAPTYKALLLIVARSEDHVPPGETDPSLLWKSFIDQHVLNLPADAPALRLNSILGIVRSLRLKDCAPLFRRAFAANPSVDLARQLHELGDLTGIDYLRKELNAAEIEKRVLAAAALAELGFPEGVQSLLENVQQNVSASRRFSFQVLKALDVYIQAKDRADPTRKSTLDFVVARMGDPLFQHRCFGIVQRESGEDFGYPVTQPLPDTERRAALEEAVRKAQAWWAEERDRSPPRQGGEER
jgi:hypothetical protein